MKAVKSATALSLLSSTVDSRPHVKAMHDTDSVDLVNTGKVMVKEVSGFWGAEYMRSSRNCADDDTNCPNEEDRDFRFEVGLDADLGLGYEGLIFWIVREGKNLMVLNPTAFFEVASHSWILFKLYFWEIRFSLDLTGYKITPIDYQATWDIDNKKDYCQSVGAVQDVLDMEFHVETRVYECFFGLIGWMVGTSKVTDDDDPSGDPDNAITGDDLKDCSWVRYYPQLPLYALTAKEEWDRLWDYREWSCNYYNDSGRWTEEENNGTEINGFGDIEPSNVV